MATVVVADDEPEIRQMLTILLTSQGYTVVEAVNGQEVLEQVRDTPIDLILMDLNMPIMPGWEATAALKADPAFKSIPIVAITAHGLGTVLDKAWEAGIDDFVPKPLDVLVLLETVKGHLQAKKQSHQA